MDKEEDTTEDDQDRYVVVFFFWVVMYTFEQNVIPIYEQHQRHGMSGKEVKVS
jgi:hypothetical protein